MPCWIITFFIGTNTLQFCHKLPSLYWLLIIIPTFFIWLISTRKRIFLQPLIGALGFSWVLIYTHIITGWELSPELEGKKLLVTGYIVAPAVNKSYGDSFKFQTTTIAAKPEHTRIKLSWYGKHPPINAGDKWQLNVRLKRPHGVLNPGGFDTEKYFLVHHIRASGYVVASESNQKLESKWYRYPLARLRQFLMNKMDRALIFEPLTPVIVALVTGAEDKITKEQWQVMRNTGTSYLVAISGLHVGLVASTIFFLVQFLWKFSSRLPLILPAREAGIVVGLVVGFIYGAIAGFSIPTQRALVMLLLFSLMVLWRRYTQSWNAFLWSLFVVLLINPLAILTVGFWLSFTAVAAIIYVSGNRIKHNSNRLHKFWRLQITVTLSLLPFTLLFFQQISLTTLIANLIAMPVVCMVVVPLSLLGTLGLLFSEHFGGWILWCNAKLFHLVWYWLEFLANFSNNSWYHPVYNWWILIAAIVGFIILLAPRGLPAKWIGGLWILPLFFYAPSGPRDGEFWFTVLDVGQGLAAIVQTRDHVLLYDTGPKFLNHDAGSSIIIPYLRAKNIRNIDMLVVSHGDMDHFGGAQSILNAVPVNKIIASVPEKLTSSIAQSCFAGQRWEWDGVDFQVLSPPKNSLLVGNNASCVVKVTRGSNSILLPGDIEHDAEKTLVENYGTNLKSTVLVAPHHGSTTSSSIDLINAVTPKHVIFPAGYKNRFRFPHKKIIKRYLKNKVVVLNTFQTGAIFFKFKDKSAILSPAQYRDWQRRFWHDN